jgi:uncharacterized membrane protein YcaP (DUF421 family)
MSLVIRAVIVYAFLMLLMRVSGKRQFARLTPFDLVLLLIIAEAVQQALLGSDDFSLTTALILVTTLVSVDIGLSLLKQYSGKADLVLEGAPVVLLDDGKLITEHMRKERVDEADILTAARENFGIEKLDDVRYAILERTGTISIIPRTRRLAASA